MSYYFLTSNGKIFKSVGVRKVKQILAPKVYRPEKFSTRDISLSSFVLPMIRRVYPQLITNEIVNVQPMKGPVGTAFIFTDSYSLIDTVVDIKHARKSSIERRKIRNRQRDSKIDSMPIDIFRAKYSIRKESSNFYDIMFELTIDTLKN